MKAYPMQLKSLLMLGVLFVISFFQIYAQDSTSNNLEDVQGMRIRPNFKAIYTPFFGVITQKGESSFHEKQITSDIENGYGYGVYIGMDLVDKFDAENFNIGFGLIFQESKHDSNLDIYHLTADSYLFEVNLYNTFYRSKKLDIVQQFGISGGAVVFSYDKNRDDFASGMSAIRYLINFEFFKHYDLDVGGGLFIWGQPGDTLAYGGLFMIQLGYRF